MHLVKRKPYPEQRQLKAEMALAGLKIAEVARLSGYQPSYITHLLNGYAFSEDALAKVAAAIAANPQPETVAAALI